MTKKLIPESRGEPPLSCGSKVYPVQVCNADTPKKLPLSVSAAYDERQSPVGKALQCYILAMRLRTALSLGFGCPNSTPS
jgi:hypothetical protein